jgi:glutathionyl-hydroquinone reductase
LSQIDTTYAQLGSAPLLAEFLLTREMKGLQDYLPVDIVRPYPKQWLFPETNDEYPGATVDRLFYLKAMSEIYHMNEPDRKDKFSVPLLWDKKTNQIVNNESEDIMRMLNTVFNEYLPANSTQQLLDFYPPELRPQIDEINSWLCRI